MGKYRKKPVIIDAIPWDGGNVEELKAFCPKFEQDAHKLFIDTLEGTMVAMPGDWIIRGVAGEFYPCKPDIFADTYERVQDNE